MYLTKEVQEISEGILEVNNKLSQFEALQIAVQIQRNRVLENAFLVNRSNQPVALEKIAMEMEGLSNVAAGLDSISTSLDR